MKFLTSRLVISVSFKAFVNVCVIQSAEMYPNILFTSLVGITLIQQAFGQGNLVRKDAEARIISYNSENNGIDGYKFSYVLDDGTERTESGSFVNGVWTVIGSVAWDSDNGRQSYTYRADDKGSFFSPVGTAIEGYGGGGVGYGGLSSSSLSSLAGVG